MIRKFVHAALRGMKDMMDDPDKAADEFVSFVPEWKGKEDQRQVRLQHVRQGWSIRGRRCSARSNADRLTKLQDFYLAKGFIQKATPVDELYTNEFIK